MSGTLLLAPWALCLAAAIWFGWMARGAGRNWILWALGGGMFALLASTIVIGLMHAGIIALSHDAQTLLDFGSVALAGVMVMVLGWFFTDNLHRHHRSFLAWLKTRFGQNAPDAGASKR